jgi:hypothetical protein
LKDDGWTEVRETNLRAGELVIVEGGYNLPAGADVRVGPRAAKKSESAGPPTTKSSLDNAP